MLGVMASLVANSQGASLMIRQTTEAQHNPAMEMLTWRKVFTVVYMYCERFKQAMAAAPGGASGLEGVMNRADTLGLVAYIKLFT